MATQEDTRFGEVAVTRGFITRSQLDDGIQALEFVTQAGLKRSLGDILVEKGLLTELQAQIVARTSESGEAQIIAGFELIDKLGEGGMGSVYKAKQISMDRLVALKTLSKQLAENREFTARFVREARTAAMLDHVNIVRGLDVGSEGDIHYFAMEFVEGESVGTMIKRDGAIPEDRAMRIIIQIARALEYAWKTKQIIHRDIKPDNILVTKDDVAKLADLGLARTTDTESTMMTQTGVAMGTPHYISPEQARGERDIDTRTDIYSLGATLYHMLTGTVPFAATSAMAVITKHLTEPLVPPHAVRSEVSEHTSAVVEKMMAKEASQRYADPSQLLEDLELAADGKAPRHAGGALAPSNTETLMGAADMARATEAPAAEPVPATPTRSVVPFIVVAAAVVAIAIVGVVLALSGPDEDATPAADAGTPEPVPAVAEASSLSAPTPVAPVAPVESREVGAIDQAEKEIAGVLRLKRAKRFAEARVALKNATAILEEVGLGDEAADLMAGITEAEILHARSLVSQGREHEKKREWNDARAKYREALKYLAGAERDDVSAILDGLDGRMHLEDAVAAARRAAEAGQWRSVWDNVARARRPGVKDERIDELARSAIVNLAPKRTVTAPLGMEMVLVRGGSFAMGSDDGEPDESPVHRVTVSSFYMGRHEVTRAQFEAYRQGLRAVPDGGDDGRLPAGSISWKGAVSFCAHLTNADDTGARYRLPTEAEWEFAARGTEGRAYPWGDEPPKPDRANAVFDGSGDRAPSRVGSLPRGNTPLGLCDMAGNVFEWCADWHGPYASSPLVDPRGPSSGTRRIARGGAYSLDASALRASLRGTRPPDKPLPIIGFRVVRELTDEQRMFERLATE